jgi:transcriptional regulator with XRE-family HTH domain
MNDDVFTGDLDLASVQTRAQLASLLRTVHVRADRPSLRVLEAKTRRDPAPLSKTAVSEMLKGARFPRKAVMVSFLRACGVSEEMIEPWRRGWERLAVAGQDQGYSQVADERDRGPAGAAQAADPPRADHPGEPSLSAAREDVPRAGTAALPGPEVEEPRDPGSHRVSARAAPGPLARRRELGALLRDLRSRAGLTIEQVAESLLCSPSKVSRMETGFRSGTLRDIRDLCDLYKVRDSSQREYLMELAREGKRQGWWQSHDLPFGFGTYVGLEADATSIRSYNAVILPGLLQTEDYARAVLKGARGSTSEWIEELVAVRLRRQGILSQDFPTQLYAVIDEAALRRVVGSPEVMKAQLAHMLEQASLANIVVQVIPYSAGAYEGVDSSFSILELPVPMHEIAYAEGIFGFIYLERPQDVERCQRVFLDMQAVALSARESVALISEISVELTGKNRRSPAAARRL